MTRSDPNWFPVLAVLGGSVELAAVNPDHVLCVTPRYVREDDGLTEADGCAVVLSNGLTFEVDEDLTVVLEMFANYRAARSV